MLLLISNGPVIAAEPGELPPTTEMDSPTDPKSSAIALVEALLSISGTNKLNTQWVLGHVKQKNSPLPMGHHQVRSWVSILGPSGRLGQALRKSEQSFSVLEGPDYYRIVIETPILMSAIVWEQKDHRWMLDSLALTSCSLCDEPTRFVRDLLAEITRKGEVGSRLIPGIELDMGPYPGSTNGQLSSHLTSAIQAHVQASIELQKKLIGAEITGTTEHAVNLIYSDGSTDIWPLHYRNGYWAIIYHDLPKDSPIRPPSSATKTTTAPATARTIKLQNWSPTWKMTEQEGGMEVGHYATGAHFDPLDESIWIVVMDVDRKAPLLSQIDPNTQQVLQRIPIPETTQQPEITIADWFSSWPSVFSESTRMIATAQPGRIRLLDLAQPPHTAQWRSEHITFLDAYEKSSNASTIQPTLFFSTQERVQSLGPIHLNLSIPLSDTPILIAPHKDEWLVVYTDGQVTQFDSEGAPLEHRVVCNGSAIDACLSSDEQELIVVCRSPNTHALERLQLNHTPEQLISGSATGRTGCSWSHDGRLFITGTGDEHADSLSIWNADTNQPMTSFGHTPVHKVSFSPKDTHVLTHHKNGTVRLWELDPILE